MCSSYSVLYQQGAMRGQLTRVNESQLFRMLARRGHPRPPFNSRAIGTPDDGSLTKNTIGSNARLSAIWRRKGKKSVSLLILVW
jgi:hypothetical protein